MTVEITHTTEAGSLVDGTARGDGAAPILKRHGLRWGRSIGQWYVPHSRDRVGDRWKLERLAADLEAGGFTVALSIANEAQSTADVEARRTERAHERHDGLTARAERLGDQAQVAFDQFRQTLDAIPPGQPILVGHHSERGHRAALKRADRAIARSSQLDAESKAAEHAAGAALREQRKRKTPAFIGNRISEREATERDLQRRLDGTASVLTGPAEGTYRADTEARLAQVRDELAYWRSELAGLEDAGVRLWGPDDFERGDLAKIRGRWAKVARVNRKTVAIETGYSWTNKYPWTEVQDRRAAAEVEAA